MDILVATSDAFELTMNSGLLGPAIIQAVGLHNLGVHTLNATSNRLLRLHMMSCGGYCQ